MPDGDLSLMERLLDGIAEMKRMSGTAREALLKHLLKHVEPEALVDICPPGVRKKIVERICETEDGRRMVRMVLDRHGDGEHAAMPSAAQDAGAAEEILPDPPPPSPDDGASGGVAAPSAAADEEDGRRRREEKKAREERRRRQEEQDAWNS